MSTAWPSGPTWVRRRVDVPEGSVDSAPAAVPADSDDEDDDGDDGESAPGSRPTPASGRSGGRRRRQARRPEIRPDPRTLQHSSDLHTPTTEPPPRIQKSRPVDNCDPCREGEWHDRTYVRYRHFVAHLGQPTTTADARRRQTTFHPTAPNFREGAPSHEDPRRHRPHPGAGSERLPLLHRGRIGLDPGALRERPRRTRWRLWMWQGFCGSGVTPSHHHRHGRGVGDDARRDGPRFRDQPRGTAVGRRRGHATSPTKTSNSQDVSRPERSSNDGWRPSSSAPRPLSD